MTDVPTMVPTKTDTNITNVDSGGPTNAPVVEVEPPTDAGGAPIGNPVLFDPTNEPVALPTNAPVEPTNPPTTNPTTNFPTRAPVAPTSAPFILVRPTLIIPNVPIPISTPVPIPYIPQIPRPAPTTSLKTLAPYIQSTMTNIRRPSSATSNRFSSLRSMWAEAEADPNSVSLSLALAGDLTLVLEGVAELPESSWSSIQTALEEHTTFVVSSIFPALHFQSAIELVAVIPNEEAPEVNRHKRGRNLRPAPNTRSLTLVYNELTEFDQLPGTEDLDAGTLSALAFESSQSRKDFVDKIRREFANDSILQNLVGVSTVALPPTPRPSAWATQTATATQTQAPHSPTIHTGNTKEPGNEILTSSGESFEAEDGAEDLYGSKPDDLSVLDASAFGIIGWVAVSLGVLTVATALMFQRKGFR